MELSVFTSISFSKQSAFWKVLELRDLCGLSTDSQKIYSVNRLLAETKYLTRGLSAGSEITEKTRKVFIDPFEIQLGICSKRFPLDNMLSGYSDLTFGKK